MTIAARDERRPDSATVDRDAIARIAAVLARIAAGTHATVSPHSDRGYLDAEVSEVLYRAVMLKVDEFLAPGSHVEVRFNSDIAVRGSVVRCQPRDAIFDVRLDLFDARLHPVGREIRLDERFEVRIPATLRVSDGIGPLYMIEIVDVSRSGLRLRSERGVPPGTRVEINCRGQSISGEVRYCRHVGLEEYYMCLQVLPIDPESTLADDFDLNTLRHTH